MHKNLLYSLAKLKITSMKALFLIAIFCFPFVKIQAQNDSIKAEQLPEVNVNANGQIETAEKAVLLPSALEKRHSANGFDLLSVMQNTGLEVSPSARSITTQNGGAVALCINGMEVQPDEVATLRAKNIRSIEYVRTPGGKYAGKAALINFITIQLEYGGNVYLSATEGLTYQMGDYLAFADYTRKKLTLSLTASGDWARDHSYNEGQEDIAFADGNSLARQRTNLSSLRESNDQAVRLKLTSRGKQYRWNSYVSLVRQEVPRAESDNLLQYSGDDGKTEQQTNSDSRTLSPTVYGAYTRWLPKNQILDMNLRGTWGRNHYHSLYRESTLPNIISKVTEDNNAISANANYYKTWTNGTTLTTSLSYDLDNYKDIYVGSVTGDQRLTTEVSMALVQLSRATAKCYYYISAGASYSAVELNSLHYDYAVPVSFYGANYAISQSRSLSFNGHFTHTLFAPSNKNDMSLRTSTYDAVQGNPDLAPIKVLGNSLSYNSQRGKASWTLSYDNNIYFDNIVHRYQTDDNTLYNMAVNDGTFIGHLFSATVARKLLRDKLRLSATAIEEYNILRGDIYDMHHNIFRVKASVTYLSGAWKAKYNFRSPYKTLDIRQPYYITRQPQHEWSLAWHNQGWSIEALVRNPFARYQEQHITMDYGCYRLNSYSYDQPTGCNVNFTVTYSLGYGKKVERGNTDIDKHINSAIMKAY